MFKLLNSIFLGRAARAQQALETQNAAIIIEQKIREAEAGHGSAKRGLASLITRRKSEQKALDYIEVRIKDLESRIELAVQGGNEELAFDAARLLADLENERKVRQNVLTQSGEKAGRIRLSIEKTHRQIIDLKQGLITARSIEAERSAIAGSINSQPANSAIKEGEAVLGRLLQSHDPISDMEALEEIEADLSGGAVIDRLSGAGFGPSERIRPEDVLARFQKPSRKKTG